MDITRKIGINILKLMQENNVSREELADRLNYSYRDICKILDGRLILSPKEIEAFANFFGKSKQELSYLDNIIFDDKILDIIDDYVNLREAL